MRLLRQINMWRTGSRQQAREARNEKECATLGETCDARLHTGRCGAATHDMISHQGWLAPQQQLIYLVKLLLGGRERERDASVNAYISLGIELRRVPLKHHHLQSCFAPSLTDSIAARQTLNTTGRGKMI